MSDDKAPSLSIRYKDILVTFGDDKHSSSPYVSAAPNTPLRPGESSMTQTGATTPRNFHLGPFIAPILKDRLDVEGRYSVLESPPPPPGVSPSLLRPTPGKYVANASSLLNRGSKSNLSSPQVPDLPSSEDYHRRGPLPPPKLRYRIEAEKDSSSTVSDLLLDPHLVDLYAPKDDSIELYNWYISFAVKGKRALINKDVDNLSHWIFVTGTRIVSDKNKTTGERWHSSLITSRPHRTVVKTRSGKEYRLHGPIDWQMQIHRKGFSHEVSKAFRDGFPSNWVDLVTQEARRRGLTISKREDGSSRKVNEKYVQRDPTFDPFPVEREARSCHERPSENLTQDRPASPVKLNSSSHTPVQTRHASHSLLKRKSVEDDTKVPKRRPHSVSRELAQLSKTAFGQLTLVKNAIADGLGDDQGDSCTVQNEGKRVRRQAPKTPSTPSISEPGSNPEAAPRSSSRKRGSLRRWWEVQNLSDSQIKIVGRKESSQDPIQSQSTADMQDEHASEGTEIVEKTIDETELETTGASSEDEYSCAADEDISSSDEEPDLSPRKPHSNLNSSFSKRPQNRVTGKRLRSRVAKRREHFPLSTENPRTIKMKRRTSNILQAGSADPDEHLQSSDLHAKREDLLPLGISPHNSDPEDIFPERLENFTPQAHTFTHLTDESLIDSQGSQDLEDGTVQDLSEEENAYYFSD